MPAMAMASSYEMMVLTDTCSRQASRLALGPFRRQSPKSGCAAKSRTNRAGSRTAQWNADPKAIAAVVSCSAPSTHAL